MRSFGSAGNSRGSFRASFESWRPPSCLLDLNQPKLSDLSTDIASILKVMDSASSALDEVERRTDSLNAKLDALLAEGEEAQRRLEEAKRKDGVKELDGVNEEDGLKEEKEELKEGKEEEKDES